MVKVLERTGLEGTSLNVIKVIYEKLTAKISLNEESLKKTD